MKILMTSTVAFGAVCLLAMNQPTIAENTEDSNIQLVRGDKAGRGGGGGRQARGGGSRHVGSGQRGGHHHGGHHHRGHHHRGHHHGGHHHGGNYQGGHHHHHHLGAVGVGLGIGAVGSTIINQNNGSTTCHNRGYDNYGNSVCLDY